MAGCAEPSRGPDLAGRVIAAVDRAVAEEEPRYVALLQDLIATPSETGREGSACDARSCVGKLALALDRGDAGLALDAQTVEAGRDNLIAVLPGTGGRGRRALIVTAHVDTVPPGDPAPWHRGDPFSGETGWATYLGSDEVLLELDGCRYRRKVRRAMAQVWEARGTVRRPIVYGRGSFDNKGCAVIALWLGRTLAAALRDAGARLGGDLILLFTVGEETDNAGIKQFVGWEGRRGWPGLAAYGPGALLGVCLEGSYSYLPVIGHRGSAWYRLRVEGRGAHAATPHLGINAAEAMGSLIHLLRQDAELARQLAELFDASLLGEPTWTVSTLVSSGVGDGGRLLNRVPDWCEATLDVRYPPLRAGPAPGHDAGPARGHRREAEQVLALFRAAVARLMTSLPEGLRWNLDLYDPGAVTPPVALARDLAEAHLEPLVAAAARAVTEVAGYAPWPAVAPGATDATFLVHGAGVRCLIEFGPGGGLSHDVHEFVDRGDLADGVRILARLAAALLGVVPETGGS